MQTNFSTQKLWTKKEGQFERYLMLQDRELLASRHEY